MLLDVPFYKNNENGNQCLQVGMQTVFKYYLNKEYSLNQLDKLTGRYGDLWTWTAQIVPVLYDLGLKVEYYGGTDYELFSNLNFIKKHFRKDAQIVIDHTDFKVLKVAIKKLSKYNLFIKENITIDDIKKHIKNDHLVLVTVDNSKLYNRKEPFEGHMIVLTGFSKSGFYYHDSGPINPKPNLNVSFETFSKASDLVSKDQDIVIVYGAR